jgi:hypothetical protein
MAVLQLSSPPSGVRLFALRDAPGPNARILRPSAPNCHIDWKRSDPLKVVSFEPLPVRGGMDGRR